MGLFSRAEFLILIKPMQLWPSMLVALVVAIIRKIVNYYFTNTAIRITHQKITLSKPVWLHKNPQKYEKIMNLMETSNDTELNKHIMDLNLSSNKTRELQSYITTVKQGNIQTDKFLESIFKLITITPISLYGIYICYIRNDFFFDHYKQWIHFGDENFDIYDNQCNVNYVNEPFIQKYDEYILFYYVISFGYHLNRALTQFFNPKRKDFIALFIHHWVTLGLMVCSFVSGKLRTGCVTLAIHEYSDIFLESGKLCQYMKFQLGADVFFVFFLLSWIIFRMYSFCYKLLYSVAVCGYYTIWNGDKLLIFAAVNILFLCILQCIHIYWFTMILKVIQNKLKGKQIADVRSDDEHVN
eukprot:306177_1